MLGENAWCITSEKNYWHNRPAYYKNLQLGVNYYEVKYEKAIPFLLMLPNALKDVYQEMSYDKLLKNGRQGFCICK